MVQAALFPNVDNGSGYVHSILNVTGTGIIGAIRLPYNDPNGTAVFLGDPDLGYPESLYPRLMYSNNASTDSGLPSFQGTPLTTNSSIFLGPLTVNSSFSLFSCTMPVLSLANSNNLLGWVTVVIDASQIYQITTSREGLGKTGETLLIGPATPDNLFHPSVYRASAEEVGQREVRFVLPPIYNASLGTWHRLRGRNASDAGIPFLASAYPAVVDAWTKDNDAINNAGALISTTEEEGLVVSVGYANVSSRLVDWILVVEQSHDEVVAPIKHLRDVVIACVLGRPP